MQELMKSYESRKSVIKRRLEDFKQFFNEPYSWFYEGNRLQLKRVNKNDDERLFEELCFCILTANASAKMGLRSVDSIRNVLINGGVQDIQIKLNGVHRFPNIRAEYIVHTRNYLIQNFDFKLKDKIQSFHDKNDLRNFFAATKDVKGMGMKEASHFLRNVGCGDDIAILDRHVLKNLKKFDVINDIPKSLTAKKYLEIEEKMRRFAEKTSIPLAELDLLFWSGETGEVFK